MAIRTSASGVALISVAEPFEVVRVGSLDPTDRRDVPPVRDLRRIDSVPSGRLTVEMTPLDRSAVSFDHDV